MNFDPNNYNELTVTESPKNRSINARVSTYIAFTAAAWGPSVEWYRGVSAHGHMIPDAPSPLHGAGGVDVRGRVGVDVEDAHLALLGQVVLLQGVQIGRAHV